MDGGGGAFFDIPSAADCSMLWNLARALFGILSLLALRAILAVGRASVVCPSVAAVSNPASLCREVPCRVGGTVRPPGGVATTGPAEAGGSISSARFSGFLCTASSRTRPTFRFVSTLSSAETPSASRPYADFDPVNAVPACSAPATEGAGRPAGAGSNATTSPKLLLRRCCSLRRFRLACSFARHILSASASSLSRYSCSVIPRTISSPPNGNLLRTAPESPTRAAGRQSLANGP